MKKTLETDKDLLKLDRSAVPKVEGMCPLPKATVHRCTGGSVASGSDAGGCEFDSDWTNTQGLKITEEKVLPL